MADPAPPQEVSEMLSATSIPITKIRAESSRLLGAGKIDSLLERLLCGIWFNCIPNCPEQFERPRSGKDFPRTPILLCND